MNKNLLVADLRRDEGERLTSYKDTEGLWTIGIGHLIDPSRGANPSPFGIDLRNGGTITSAQSEAILMADIDAKTGQLNRLLPWWNTLSDSRQRVLLNMAFNMGVQRLLNFVKTIAAVKEGRYSDAAEEMLDSKWAEQVGKSPPNQKHPEGQRAWRLAEMMVQG